MILRGTVYSKELEMDTGITIVAPPDYKEKAPYQVAYVLHGIVGNNATMVDYSLLPVYARETRCVFIMPEVGRSFYTDMVHGLRYFSYVAKELPEICKSLFQISGEPKDTFVMGTSMGGYGALKCALTYPEQYGACCALAAGPLFLRGFFRQLREGDTKALTKAWGEQFLRDLQSTFGENYAWKPEYELLDLAKKIKQPEKAPRFYAACGTEDTIVEINRQFYAEMRKLPVNFTYEEWSGKHNFYFFNEGLKKSLDFCLKS